MLAPVFVAILLVDAFLRPRIRDPFDRDITGLSEAAKTRSSI